MAMMKFIVFDVEQGKYVYVRTPNDYGVLLDSSNGAVSQVEWLAENEVPSLKNQAIVSPTEDFDFGASVRQFSLSQSEAEALGGDVAGNSSVVTVINYSSAEGYSWKAVIAGDNEAKGWEALLAKPEFSAAIADADFFVTSKQGQDVGFSADLFAAMGKPIAIISSKHGDESVDKRYNKQAQGVKFPDGKRGHFVTGGDGNITVEMHDDGRYDVWLFTPKSL